jgi:hypothetical protein
MPLSEPTPVPGVSKNERKDEAQIINLGKRAIETTKKELIAFQGSDPQEYVADEKRVGSLKLYLGGLGVMRVNKEEYQAFKELKGLLDVTSFDGVHAELEEARLAALERMGVSLEALEEERRPKRKYVKAEKKPVVDAQAEQVRHDIEAIGEVEDTEQPTQIVKELISDTDNLLAGEMTTVNPVLEMEKRLKALAVDDLTFDAATLLAKNIAKALASDEVPDMIKDKLRTKQDMLATYIKEESRNRGHASIYAPDELPKVQEKSFVDKLKFWK